MVRFPLERVLLVEYVVADRRLLLDHRARLRLVDLFRLGHPVRREQDRLPSVVPLNGEFIYFV